MATNPMRRKSRNAFILGMLLMLVIAAIVVVFLVRKIQSQQDEIEEYQQTTSSVYILNTDVVSGQVLTTDMFTISSIATTTIPSNATTDVYTALNSYSLSDTDGHSIFYNTTDGTYYIAIDGNNYNLYSIVETTSDDGSTTSTEQQSTNLTTEDEAYYYTDEANKDGRTTITVSSNAVVAKVDLNAKTVITSSLITRADEKTTDDLREMEYNVITLPTELITGDYVDVRLSLPNGQDFIVVAKKQVTVPILNGSYSTDTIQMNLTEKEILYMASAIVESYQIEGSNLYVSIYTEAGLQEEATVTYYPSNDVIELIQSNDNIVDQAIEGIKDRRSQINEELNKLEEDEVNSTVEEGVSESVEATEESRQTYLQGLTSTTSN